MIKLVIIVHSFVCNFQIETVNLSFLYLLQRSSMNTSNSKIVKFAKMFIFK